MRRRNPPLIVATTLGLLFALSAFIHGWFAALQGGTPMPSRFFEAIGPAHRFWLHGNEPAFSLMPGFLATGLSTMTLAVVVAVWALRYMHRTTGPAGFLALMVAVTLVGGGIGHIAFFLPTWLWARTLPRAPAPWHVRLGRRRGLVALWAPALGITAAAWLIAQFISVVGWVPGVTDPDAIFAVCWTFLGIALVGLNVAFPLAYAARAAQG